MTTYHPNGTVESDTETSDPGMAKSALESFDKHVSNAQERVGETAQEIDRAVRSTGEESARFVRENPALALFGALAVGMIIGLGIRGQR